VFLTEQIPVACCQHVKCDLFCRENVKARTNIIRQILTTRSTSHWLDIMASIRYENVQGSCTWAFSSFGLSFCCCARIL